MDNRAKIGYVLRTRADNLVMQKGSEHSRPQRRIVFEFEYPAEYDVKFLTGLGYEIEPKWSLLV
jgi:hypothetical protein